MTAHDDAPVLFPKPCGRLDRHDEHEWTGHWPTEATTTPLTRAYRCVGRVLLEGGMWADWDAADDAAEERVRRDRIEQAIEDALREGWGA